MYGMDFNETYTPALLAMEEGVFLYKVYEITLEFMDETHFKTNMY
jgi:ribulose bisphosphate carboxylase small subunit